MTLGPWRTIFLAAVAAPLLTGRVTATPLAYDIHLDAPAPQRKLLEGNLDLYRWRGSERMDGAQLRRLVSQAPEQIGSLLSTEGFYSPRIRARLVEDAQPWRVELEVEPGTPTQVQSVAI